LITVQEAVKIPVIRPVLRGVPSHKEAVFFECREGQVFFVDKDGMNDKVEKLMGTLNPSVRGGNLSDFLKAVSSEEIGDEYYKVDTKYLLTGNLALEARPGAK